MGPLAGVTIVEVASLGPGPFCSMMLADMGADVIRIDRADAVISPGDRSASPDLLNRGRPSVGVDLKHPKGVEVALRLCDDADGLVEGFRPGVAERLGLGPNDVHARNPRLVYGRMTGWGQDGPYASQAGHDIDYLAVSGILGMLGPAGARPWPPLNLVADFGGGGMMLAFGMVCGLLEAGRSGEGQVIDAAMVDGASLLSTMIYGLMASGLWSQPRGHNLLDGGAPFYSTYETHDGRYMAVGAIEPPFYAQLVELLDVDVDADAQMDPNQWEETRRVFAAAFSRKSQQEWTEVFAGSDACVAPVRSLHEAYGDPHVAARGTIVEIAGIRQPSTAPRFSRTVADRPGISHRPGSHTDEVLSRLGWDDGEIEDLRAAGAVK